LEFLNGGPTAFPTIPLFVVPATALCFDDESRRA
jgi:hypothetical protein